MHSVHPHDELIDAFSYYLTNHSRQSLVEAGYSERVTAFIEVFDASYGTEVDLHTLANRFRMPETICKKMLVMYKVAQMQKVI